MGTERKMVDSGVEWIGETPSGWNTNTLLEISRWGGGIFIDGDWIESSNISESGVRYLTSGNVGPGRYKEQGSGFITEETFSNLKCTEVQYGDILISRLNLPIGRACLIPNLGVRIVTAVDNVIFRPNPGIADNKFLVYRLSSPDYFEYTEGLANGTAMKRIPRSILGKIKISLPPLPEQQAIATFLDHHVGLIDRERELIAQKIGLLKDKRKALIFECVTGKRTIVEAQHLAGVDDWSDIVGSGPLVAVPTPGKDDPFVKGGRLVESGVDWIGEVPEGWEVHPLGKVAAIFNGGTPKTDPDFWEGEVHWATPADFKNGETLYSTKRCLTEAGARAAGRLLPAGTVLVSSRAPVGKVCWVGIPTSFNQGCKGIVAYSFLNQRFAFYSLQAGAMEMEALSTGTTFLEINTAALARLRIALPSLGAQETITTFLDHQVSLVDREIKLLETKSSLLADKRKALIFEAVTGKLDCTHL